MKGQQATSLCVLIQGLFIFFGGVDHQFRLVLFIQARDELVSIAMAASLGWMDSIKNELGADRFVPRVSGHTTRVPSPQPTNRNAECVEREQAHGPAADGGGCDDPTGSERHA